MSDLKVGRIEQLTHTAGPWMRRREQPFIIAAPMDIHVKPGEPPQHFDDAKSVCDVRVSHSRVGFEESDANARLIAAAPELLAALKALLNANDSREKALAFDAARAAIAKAEGQ